jgi:hypothetical protein
MHIIRGDIMLDRILLAILEQLVVGLVALIISAIL